MIPGFHHFSEINFLQTTSTQDLDETMWVESPNRSDFLTSRESCMSGDIIPETQIKTEQIITKRKKLFNFGISFDRNKFEEVRPLLSRLKHLEMKRINDLWFFDVMDIIKIMDLGKPQKRKKCVVTQTDL